VSIKLSSCFFKPYGLHHRHISKSRGDDMKTRLPLIILMLILLSISCMAFEQIGKMGITQENSNWLSGTRGTTNYPLNLTDIGQADNMPLVYDINGDGLNEIIQSRSNVIKVYNVNSTLVTSKTIANLGDRQLTAFNSTSCASHQALYGLESNGTAFELCWNSTIQDFTTIKTCTATNSGTTGTNQGISMILENGGVYGAFAYTKTSGSKEIQICNFTGTSDHSYPLNYTGTAPILASGNPLNDGKQYWITQYSHNGTDKGAAYFNKEGSITQINIHGMIYSLDVLPDVSPTYVKRGSGQADAILLPINYIPYSGVPSRRTYLYMDSTGYVYSYAFGVATDNCPGYISNPLQLGGVDGDICFIEVHGCTQKNFICKNPNTLSTTYSKTIATAPYSNARISAMDMNNDGYSDFFIAQGTSGAQLCLYTGNANPLTCTSLGGGDASYVYGIDIDNDLYRDIVFSDNTNDMFQVKLTHQPIVYQNPALCPGTPGQPYFALDNFDYSLYVNTCHWTIIPSSNIAPTGGQLCYSGTPDRTFDYFLQGEGNFFSHDTFSEEWDMTIANTSFLEKNLRFQVLSTGGSRMVYNLGFFSDSGHTYAQYLENNGTAYFTSSLCTDCFATGQLNHVKVTIYGYNAVGYQFFNQTSHTYQAIHTETIAIKINEGDTLFNIPVVEPAQDMSNIPRFAAFSISEGSLCIDNYALWQGTTENPEQQINATGEPFAQPGEPCTTNSDCYTGKCDISKVCSRKQQGAQCLSDFECVSQKCVRDKCSKPSLWQNIDQGKTDWVGNDANSNNLIALFLAVAFAIGLGVAVTLLAGNVGMAGIGFLLGLVISIFFFTVVGWLSPFILIGIVIVFILVVVMAVVLGTGKG